MANDAIPDPKAIDWARKDAARKDFSRHANLAFLIKCFGIGAIALLIPITLPIVGGYDGHFSISFFYHVPEARNWFVGLLWAVGIFLVLFQGLSRAENLLLIGLEIAVKPASCKIYAFNYVFGRFSRFTY